MKNLIKIPTLPPTSIDIKKMLLIGILVSIATFFGLASAILPFQFLLIFVSIPFAIFLAVLFPKTAFFSVLVISFGLIPQFIFGALSLGGALLQPAEILLTLIFTILLIRGAGYWHESLLPAKSLITPFLFLTLGLLFAFFQGKIISHYQYAGADLRQYAGWLAFPVALWLNTRYPGTIHRIILTISLAAATAMVFQLISGIQVIFGFRGAEELSKEFGDIKRSALGGGEIFLVYAAYYFFAYFCVADKFRKMALIGLVIVLGGLVASFSRGIWGGFAFGCFIFLGLTPSFKRNKTMLFINFLILALFAGVVLSIAIPRVGDAMIDRVVSIGSEGGKGTSIGFRIDENLQAWTAIKSSPIFGKGLGAEYKSVFRQGAIGGGFDTEVSYIHNAYLGIWLKLGITGMLFPFLLIFLSAKKIIFARKRISLKLIQETEIRAFAAFSGLICIGIYGLTSPVWSTFSAIVVTSCLLSLIFGTSENIYSPRTNIPIKPL